MKKTTLTLDGKPLNLKPVSPSLEKVRAFLESLKDDELVTTPVLSERTGVGLTYVRDMVPLAPFKGCRHKVSRSLYWGNPRAIAALRKEIGL